MRHLQDEPFFIVMTAVICDKSKKKKKDNKYVFQ